MSAVATDRAARYREMLEKLDPKLKLKRLEEELDGREGPNGVEGGLRDSLFQSFRQAEAQERLVKRRSEIDEEGLTPAQKKVHGEGMEIAEYNLDVMWLQCDLLEESIKELEADIAAVRAAGLPKTRAERRREKTPDTA